MFFHLIGWLYNIMEIERIDNNNIKDVVRIHESAFRNFFLTTLGPKFLATYYMAVNKNINGILLGCYDGDKLFGFCSGSLVCAGFNRTIIKDNLFSFCIVGINLLLTHPKALCRLKNNLEKEDLHCEDDGNYAELASISVDPNYQGKGVGAILLNAIESYCRSKGCKMLTLTTDYEGNDVVIKFYQRNGYNIWYDFVTYPNRRMYKMRKEL